MDPLSAQDLEAGVSTAATTPSPFNLFMPADVEAPLIFASPHSGRLYPADMMAASALDAASIRRSEDAFVDALLADAVGFGIPLITGTYARAYMDLNREPYELDPRMFHDALPAFATTHTARVAAGLGSIPRVVAEGQEIYRRKLAYADAQRRIEAVHRPYHEALHTLIDRTRARFGVAVLIDWHSMPSGAARSARGLADPDFVLGDRFGAACSPKLTRVWERELEALGYVIARNNPFAGGFTTEFYGEPDKGVHTLQIEMSRRLYLDEARLQRTDGFDRLQRHLLRVFNRFRDMDWWIEL